eukprot:Platyproteum_vivax@DN7306_c0_g1_i3.p1
MSVFEICCSGDVLNKDIEVVEDVQCDKLNSDTQHAPTLSESDSEANRESEQEWAASTIQAAYRQYKTSTAEELTNENPTTGACECLDAAAMESAVCEYMASAPEETVLVETVFENTVEEAPVGDVVPTNSENVVLEEEEPVSPVINIIAASVDDQTIEEIVAAEPVQIEAVGVESQPVTAPVESADAGTNTLVEKEEVDEICLEDAPPILIPEVTPEVTVVKIEKKKGFLAKLKEKRAAKKEAKKNRDK